MITTFQSRSRRPGAVSMKESLGQHRRLERAPRWPRRQPRQVRQYERAPWTVGWFFNMRSALGSRATEFEGFGYDVPKPQPPTCRGVGEGQPRLTSWGGARPTLGTKKSTLSPPARVCSMGSRPVLHEANRARAARHGMKLPWPRRFISADAGLFGVSVKRCFGYWRGVECAPCWLRRQPRQVRRRASVLWAAGWFPTGRSARGPRAGEFESFECGVSEAAAADLVRCR